MTVQIRKVTEKELNRNEGETSYSTCTNIVKIVKDPRLPNKLSYLISPMEPVSLSSGGSFTLPPPSPGVK